MVPDEAAALLEQHAQIMQEIQAVYLVLAVCAFIGLVFLLVMIGAAAWSVNRVNKRQGDLEGKFSVLIDILLDRARREMAARQVEVIGENVEVKNG